MLLMLNSTVISLLMILILLVIILLLISILLWRINKSDKVRIKKKSHHYNLEQIERKCNFIFNLDDDEQEVFATYAEYPLLVGCETPEFEVIGNAYGKLIITNKRVIFNSGNILVDFHYEELCSALKLTSDNMPQLTVNNGIALVNILGNSTIFTDIDFNFINVFHEIHDTLKNKNRNCKHFNSHDLSNFNNMSDIHSHKNLLFED